MSTESQTSGYLKPTLTSYGKISGLTAMMSGCGTDGSMSAGYTLT